MEAFILTAVKQIICDNKRRTNAGIPAIIVEHAFLSGAADKKYLNNEASLKNLAKADAYGIAQYFGIETGGETYEPVPESKGEWRKVGGKYYYYVGGRNRPAGSR